MSLQVFVSAAIALALSAAGLSWKLERFHKAADQVRWTVPRAEAVKALATDFDNLLADSFWLQFLQYNGDKLTENPLTRRYENLVPGFGLITDLDPRFKDAYIFGSWVMGDAGESDHAVALLDRARARFPADPWYPHQSGFIEMLYRRDLARAIAAFSEAERLFSDGPQADERMRMRCAKLAAGLAERHDQKELATRIWRGIYCAATRNRDKHMVGIAQNALRRLDVTTLPDCR